MRPQSWAISAPITSRFGSFLNEDLAPRVAASLHNPLSTSIRASKGRDPLPKETKTTVASRKELRGKEHGEKEEIAIIRQWIVWRVISIEETNESASI
jgi:hypothetical protein